MCTSLGLPTLGISLFSLRVLGSLPVQGVSCETRRDGQTYMVVTLPTVVLYCLYSKWSKQSIL
jgi:hypothetical protein